MKISTKGRYALRMMLDIAEHGRGKFVPLKEVAERQNISKQYLEQIVTLVNKANLLRAARGNQGGYMIIREPSEYTVGEILRLTEGDLFPINCKAQTKEGCPRSGECQTLPMWIGLDKVVTNYVDSITLQDILDNRIPNKP
jgi:Rrf2 family protein